MSRCLGWNVGTPLLFLGDIVFIGAGPWLSLSSEPFDVEYFLTDDLNKELPKSPLSCKLLALSLD